MDFIAVQNGFIMMSHKRFQEMPVSVCGFDYSDLSGGQDKESWFCVNRLLEKLHPLEELLLPTVPSTLQTVGIASWWSMTR
jgi:hypothetical protein